MNSLEINVANTKSQLDQLETDYNAQLAQFNFLLGLPAENKTLISSSISKDLRFSDNSNYLLQREDIRLSQQVIQLKEVEIKNNSGRKSPNDQQLFQIRLSITI
jgi:outer membrane protein TolC